MIITERRIVRQEWYETECSKTGWDSYGWFFEDDGRPIDEKWIVVQYIHLDKFSNPFLAVAEKETIIN